MKPEVLSLLILNNLRDGVYFVDTERRITFWNKAAEDITGYTQAEVLGECCQRNLLNHIDREGRPLCMLSCPLHATIVDGEQRRDEVFLRHKNGHRIPVHVNIFPVLQEGETIGAIEVFTPSMPVVYEDKLIERLSDLAMTDQLTGLANRRKMESYIEYRLHELKRFGRKFCVVFLDIDDFRSFNNTYLHEVGDQVLVGLSKSVSYSVRMTDMFGRWGGEEFVGVFEIKQDADAELLAEKIRVLIAGTEIAHPEGNLTVTASLGVTVAREDDSIDSVVKRADALMYKSKRNGKNRVTSDIVG